MRAYTQLRLFPRAECRICGRALSDNKSVGRGMGPVCYKKSDQARQMPPSRQGPTDLPLGGDLLTDGLIAERRGNDRFTNVPHIVCIHSPDGFEWGYSGSGPTDMAVNAVEHLLRRVGYEGETDLVADWTTQEKVPVFVLGGKLAHEFRDRFIAPMPREGGQVPQGVLVEWVRDAIARHDGGAE